MKAKLSGISLDLYYDRMSVQKSTLTPTLARELRPLKEMSTKLGQDSAQRTAQDATSLGGPVEECLKGELCELYISVTVKALACSQH